MIPGLPLVILSASSDAADKTPLLEMGADDHLTIPFSPTELVARLRTLMRRASHVDRENLYALRPVVCEARDAVRDYCLSLRRASFT